ncbi:MAG: aminotransferase class I/II-fold pyridoxal phosphate-dependent enzyme, partial [Anaerolineae bacterium]
EGSSLPPAADLYDKAISLGVMSKTFGFAGMRIGWLATQDHESLQACLEFKCYLSICNSGPSEILALMALRAKEKILERNLKIIRFNLQLLDQFFQKYPNLFAWKRPIAGSTAFPKLLAPSSIDAFVEDLVAKEGVMLLPASVYDFPGNYFRLGFGRKDMPEALSRLERYIKHHFHRDD